MTEKPWLTVVEAAAYSGLCRDTIYKRASAVRCGMCVLAAVVPSGCARSRGEAGSMGLYKLCQHKGRERDRCDHGWWGGWSFPARHRVADENRL